MAEYKARRPQRKPTHPGEVLREDVLPSLGISISELARRLHVSRQILHNILAERGPVRPNIALRLGRFLGNGPELWLTMQQRFDLWCCEQAIAAELVEIETVR